MLKPRLIPVILIEDGLVVKTERFGNARYIGDPLNIVKIFNEKEADEICIFDIGASAKNKAPDFDLISKISAQCRMPVCYGGGIKTADQAVKIFSLGVEKVAVSSGFFEDKNLLNDVAGIVGKQSVALVLDVRKKRFGGYEIVTENGKKKISNLDIFLGMIGSLPIGEIIISSVDRDGMMGGYDLSLLQKIKNHADIPVTLVGGAGKLEDAAQIFSKFGNVAAAAGSLFIYRGKFKAVLISYPDKIQKKNLYIT